MKLLKTGALTALLIVCCLQSFSQQTIPVNEPDYNKPKIFADLPDNLKLRINDLEAVFSLPQGAQVNSVIATGFALTGVVVSKSNPADISVKSIVIKSLNRQGAFFTFTKVKNEEGSFSYAGRIMSKNASDAFVIIKEGSNYVIRKKGYYDIINE